MDYFALPNKGILARSLPYLVWAWISVERGFQASGDWINYCIGGYPMPFPRDYSRFCMELVNNSLNFVLVCSKFYSEIINQTKITVGAGKLFGKGRNKSEKCITFFFTLFNNEFIHLAHINTLMQIVFALANVISLVCARGISFQSYFPIFFPLVWS